MDYIVISQPTNGDAEVVYFLPPCTKNEAFEQAKKIAILREEPVLVGCILDTIGNNT
jgi:hypothetical protein